MVMEGQVGRRPPTCNAHHTVLQNKLAGTVWTKIDDTKVFKILDLEDLERTFSAYQRQQVTAGPRWARLGHLGKVPQLWDHVVSLVVPRHISHHHFIPKPCLPHQLHLLYPLIHVPEPLR